MLQPVKGQWMKFIVVILIKGELKMTVVYYDVEKGEHITVKNVYSVLDDKSDDFVTVCYETKDAEYSRDIEKNWLTSISVM